MNITDYGVDWFHDHVWETGEAARQYAQRRMDYFYGKHDILTQDATYANGQPKGQRVMNWIREVVMRHVGSMTPFQVTQPTAETEEADATPQDDTPDPYSQIVARQRLSRIDKLLTRDALLCGYGVEFQAFDDGEVTIYRYTPTEWAFAWEDDVLRAAVRLMTYSENDLLDGERVKEPTYVMWVYTAEEVGIFKKTEGGEWRGETQHNEIGRIPVVVWTADEEMRGIVPDELISANDEYNNAWNLEGDDIRNTVDAILVIYGVDSQWLKDNESVIRQQRTLPFDDKESQSAEYLARALDIAPHAQHLATVRENIHIMGNIPDVLRIVGASGSASGIALKLMFTPMQEAFDSYSQFLTENLRARIDLLNERWRRLNTKETYESPDVLLQFRIPTNRIEEWQNVGSLRGIVSHATMLELLSDIEDPQGELENIVNEMPEDTHESVQERMIENERRMAKLEGALLDEAQRTTEAVASIVEVLRGAVIEAGGTE